MEGFLCYKFGGLIFRGAKIFSEFCGILLGASCYRIQPSWLPYSLSSSAAAAALAGCVTNVIKPQLVTSAKQY